MKRYIWVAGLGVTLILIAVPILLFVRTEPQPVESPWAAVAPTPIHTSHAALLSGPYASGPDVTRACLACHEDAAEEVSHTAHFTWLSDTVEVTWRDEPVSTGKANLLNNFCIGIQSNWPGCTRCHAGYGWSDASFDFSEATNVDCLVCHDQSGTYLKAASGLPAEGVDLAAAARSVGRPTRQNCGTCHFYGGGGAAVKHGDLDESLLYPAETVDVHMGRLDFQCVDCHRTEDHNIRGRAISVSVETSNQVRCTDCHSTDVHTDARLSSHLDTVACQTCHIPVTAVREPTKIYWDWSTTGDETREEDPHVYLRIKGDFIYTENLMPEYAWYNGGVEYRYLLGDVMDPSVPTVLNPPSGDITDATAQIWPFKIHRAKQPYDMGYNWLIQPTTVGEGGYWTTFDWESAARMGMETVGLPYRGPVGFASTEMYWTQSHMVVPSENALQCTDCHGEGGRMDWEALGYYGDPMLWGGREALKTAQQATPANGTGTGDTQATDGGEQ